MFEFANILLLALLCSALFDAVSVIFYSKKCINISAGSVFRDFIRLWDDEHFLFGSRHAPFRQRAAVPLFAVGLAAYEFTAAFCNSMARENWAWVQGVLAPILEWTAFLCFAAKILLCTKYSWRQLCCGGALYFIARWVYFNGQNIWWIGIAVAVFAAKDIELPKAVFCYFVSGAGAVCTVLALHFAGIVAPGMTDNRTGSLRSTFGYGHPNTLGGLLFGLVLAWAIFRASRLRWADVLIIFAAACFIWFGPNSRTAALCSFALAFLLAAYKALPQIWNKLIDPLFGNLSVLLLALTACISYVFPFLLVKNGPWNNNFGPAWLGKLDQLLTCRISLAWYAFRLHDVKIAGQIVPSFPSLDNAFVYSLFETGPVMTALLILLFAVTLRGFAKSRRIPEFCCLLVLIPYAYMEMQTFHLSSNPAALLFSYAVFAVPFSKWKESCTP